MGFRRIIRSGFTDFRRNAWLSVATITVMALALFVIEGLIIFSLITQAVVATLQDKIDISVYFNPDVSENDILTLQKQVSSLPEVKSVEYISQNEALARFKTRHSSNPVILESLAELEENPLAASLNIKAKEPEKYASLAAFLSQDQFQSLINKVTYFQNKSVIERLTAIVGAIQRGGIGLSLTLAAVAVLIAFNTIRLAIYTSREEITIMKLVGASSRHIRGPYLFEGALYGLVAAILTALIFIPINAVVSPKLSAFLPGTNLYQYYASNFPILAGIIIVIGILLGIISSVIAVRRYLKII